MMIEVELTDTFGGDSQAQWRGRAMYKVRFIGTQTEYIIEANTMKDAKWIFAIQNGINSIGRISAKKIAKPNGGARK